MTDRKVSFNEIMNSSNRLKDKVVKTPLLQSSYLNQKFKTNLFLKAENLQTIGAFKYRGALNAVLQLPDNIKKVVAWSSGNHAQAVAAAAKITGREATIVMPIDSPKAKLEGTAFWGASIIKYDRKKEDREQIGKEIANKINATSGKSLSFLLSKSSMTTFSSKEDAFKLYVPGKSIIWALTPRGSLQIPSFFSTVIPG